MEKEKFDIPLLEAADIECRVQSVSMTRNGKCGAVLLIYKDARVDMRIMDKIFGPYGWQRTHELIDGTLYCNIDIWDDEKKCWVRKQDAGVESNTEKEKGRASDAFKRAGFNVGIGRELYTAPFTWIELWDDEYYKAGSQNGKDVYRTSAGVKFSVSEIGYDENRRIKTLVIVDKDGNVRFSFGSSQRPAPAPKGNGGNETSNKGSGRNSSRSGAQTATGNNAQPDAGLRCGNCGQPIRDVRRPDGSIMFAPDVALYSSQNFGVAYCAECQRKLVEQRKTQRNGQQQ